MIYLLHFKKPVKHARHYLGSADDVVERIERHRRGNGARLTQVATEQGIEMELVRTWEGGKKEERELKRQKNSPRLCPLCNLDV
jgi:predicted GIY-YIG superfamily endonuclease